MMRWITFPALDQRGIRHGFTLRSDCPAENLEENFLISLQEGGFPSARLAAAEQPHGKEVAVVDAPSPLRIPGADALITRIRGLVLSIRVADCGSVYFWDPVTPAIGLAHSGRRGTELNIVSETILSMEKNFGTRPQDLVIQLGPCIRPPHYEVHFARTIAEQAKVCGVRRFHDCGLCTASHLQDFYSYRAEKGKTGRMWAFLMLNPLV